MDALETSVKQKCYILVCFSYCPSLPNSVVSGAILITCNQPWLECIYPPQKSANTRNYGSHFPHPGEPASGERTLSPGDHWVIRWSPWTALGRTKKRSHSSIFKGHTVTSSHICKRELSLREEGCRMWVWPFFWVCEWWPSPSAGGGSWLHRHFAGSQWPNKGVQLVGHYFLSSGKNVEANRWETKRVGSL